MFYILQFTVAYVYTLRNCKIIVVILSAFFIHFYPRDGAQVLAVVVCLSVCLFVCLFVCAEFISAVFDLISIKLGHTSLGLVVSPRI